MAADRAHRGMKKESNVADGERGDLADFLVTEVALELEVDHFALVGRELLQGVVNPGKRLARVVPFVEVAGDRELLVVFYGGHASRLLPRIKREVAAHRKQPRRELGFDPCRIFPAQPQEGLLNDVPGRLQVAEEPFRVADQWPLVDVQCMGHPGGFRRPAHSVSMVDNDAGADLLEPGENPEGNARDRRQSGQSLVHARVQFSVGGWSESITITSTGPTCGSSRNPSCSCTAVNRAGQLVGTTAPLSRFAIS